MFVFNMCLKALLISIVVLISCLLDTLVLHVSDLAQHNMYLMQVYYIFSTEETILPTAWTNLQHLRRRNRVVHPVSGNGFCFINAVAKCVQVDHGIKMQLSEGINIIVQNLLENHQNYVDFHTVSAERDKLVTNSDMLINESMDFFNSRNYNNDVVDFSVIIIADALGLDLYIYQNYRGKIQVSKYSGGPISKPVYLKFTHDDVKPIGNHYDSIIKNEVVTLDENQYEDNMRPSHTSYKQVFRRPTSSTKVCNRQEIKTTIGHGKVTNEQIFETQIENNELKNKQIFNCPVSNAEVTNQQVFGNKPIQESQTSQPQPAHQKGKPVDLKMYDSSGVLYLTIKGGNNRSVTTSSSPVTTEEAENLDDTITYQGTNRDEQPEVIEIPEHDEFTSGAGKGISQLGSLMTWSLKLSQKYQRIYMKKVLHAENFWT